MANLILRQTGSITSPGSSFKDAPLTNFEVDNNFSNLNIAVGFIEQLETDSKDNIIVAVNEVFSDLGNVNVLTTTATNNIVVAVNEVNETATTALNSTVAFAIALG